jgi:hypothetical protein
VHAGTSRYQPSPQERAARAKELFDERVEKQTRLRTLRAVRHKLSGALSRPDFEMVALDHFERLEHDNHRRLCHLYGWGEKNTKASWGGNTVDYTRIAGKALSEMSAFQLQHFLVVCALLSDLAYPGSGPGHALSKKSNLARTAVRYNINIAQHAAAVRSELSKNKVGAKNRTTPAASPTQK